MKRLVLTGCQVYNHHKSIVGEENLITETVTRAKRLQKNIVEELAYYGVNITEVAV